MVVPFTRLFCQSFRHLNVFCLCALVSTTQKQNDLLPSPLEIDSEAWTEIDPEFTDSFANGLDIPCISERQTGQPKGNHSARSFVLESKPPFSEDFGLFELEHSCACSF